MKLLLDSQIILWWQGKEARVPAEARVLIERADDEVCVSRASLWEIAIKVNQGKLKVDLPDFCEHVTKDGFTWLGIENQHLLQAARLKKFANHKDPFDRLLVAQSLSEPLILLTTDSRLSRYGSTVRVV